MNKREIFSELELNLKSEEDLQSIFSANHDDLLKSVSTLSREKINSYAPPSYGTYDNLVKNPNIVKTEKKKEYLIHFILLQQKSLTDNLNDYGTFYFDFFYYRINQQNVGVAKIRIDNWNSGQMVIFYKTTPRETIELKIKIDVQENNTYLTLFSEKEEKINSLIVLAGGELNKEDRKILFGCFVSANRQHFQPCASMVILVESSNEDKQLNATKYLTEFQKGTRQLINIPPEISYFLQGKRMLVPLSYLGKRNLNDIPLASDAHNIKDIAGTYQNIHYMFNTVTPELRSYKVVISDSGTVKNYKNKPVSGAAHVPNETGYARFVGNQQLMIQLGHDAERNVFKYSILLDTKDANYFKGVFISYNNSKVSSCRLILKRHELFDIDVKTFTSKKEAHSLLHSFSNRDTNVVDFFTNGMFDTNTDAKLKYYIEDKTEVETQTPPNIFKTELPHHLLGAYLCYFPTKKEDNNPNNHDASSYGLELNILPLLISESEISIKIGLSNKKILGQYSYDGESNVMLTFVSEKYMISVLFRITEKEYIQRIYGTFNQINSLNKIESSAFVMIKQINDFLALNVKSLRHLSHLINEDIATNGAITKIIGSWNRIVLMKEDNNVFFTPRQKAYRRTFWYAAMHCIDKYCNMKDCPDNLKELILEEAYNNLFRAYNHGFGMKYFAEFVFTDTLFPNDLLEEIELALNFSEQLKSEPFKTVILEDKSPFMTRIHKLVQNKWIDFKYSHEEHTVK